MEVTDVLAVAVLDRSGSMSNVRDEAVELWNTYVRDLAADESGETWLILLGIDDQIEVWQNGESVREAVLLTHDTYVPRGMTALNDAIAHAIGLADAKLADLGRDDVKVLMPVLTDGCENASREYPGRGNPELKALIEEKEAAGNFTVVWLSADPTATPQAVAADYGVPVGNYASFSKSGQSMTSTSSALAGATRGLRGATGAKGTTGATGALSTDTVFADAGLSQDYRDESHPDDGTYQPPPPGPGTKRPR